MRMAILATALGCSAVCAWADADPTSSSGEADVVLLRGFEPDEMKRFGIPGKFLSGGPAPGYRVEPIPEGAEGYTVFRKASSRDWPKFSLFAKHATQGRYALRYPVGKPRTSLPLVTAHPPAGGYHDVWDWYYQRHAKVWSEDAARKSPLDWSAYDRLRFDVHSTDAPAVLAVRVRDMIATDRKLAHGIKTALAVFRVPKGRTVTCEFPLARMARAAELDLSQVHWAHIRLNGNEGPTVLFVDNLRLLTRDATAKAVYPLVTMEGEPGPFARPVWEKNAPPRAKPMIERRTGPVEPLGPVTVVAAPGTYACSQGHFGGHGGTYFQSARRGVVAFDNDRLLVVMGGRPPKAARPLGWGGVAEGGGMLALASFDGGKTWGGLKPGEKEPVWLKDWYWRATLCSDRFGDLYAIGTENCDSYTEGYDVFFRRLWFNGRGWTHDRFSIVDQNGYKCPGPSRVLRLSSGRIWATWNDGFGGVYAKHSDDDGLTWKPCKDASLAPPRPFYEPTLADLGKADATKPPGAVLLWPCEPVAGPLLVPFKGQVAAIAYNGSQWARHDGRAWTKAEKIPWSKARVRPGEASEAVLGDDRIVLVRSQRPWKAKDGPSDLVAMRLEGGAWKGPETLATGAIGSSILTASGKAVFCFYILKAVAQPSSAAEGKDGAPQPGAAVPQVTIYCRRWKAGAWEPAVEVASESVPLNKLAAPTVSPPSYAAVFWDQLHTKGSGSTWVKFARIPNKD